MDYLKAILFGDPGKLAQLITELNPSSTHAVRITYSSALMDIATLEQQISVAKAQVLLIDPGVAGFDIKSLMERKGTLPNPVVLVGLALSGTGDYDNLSASGMDKVYALPISPSIIQQMDSELPPLFEEVSKGWGKGVFGAVTPQSIQAAMQASTQAGWRSGIIAIISPKGGCGKTSLSVELAVMLSQIGGRTVVLSDLNMVSGHDRYFLGANAPFSIANAADSYKDWVSSGGTGSPPGSVFEPYLFSMDPDRRKLFLIPGIISSNQAAKESLTSPSAANFIRDLMEYLKRNYDFTIVDLGSDINKIVHDAALKNADFILFVIPPNRAALADARDHIATIERRGISKDKIRLVLNMVPEKYLDNMPTLEDASKILGVSAQAIVHKETTGEFENTVNIGRSFVARFASMNNNPATIEIVLRDLAGLASNFFPPLAALWSKRKVKGEKRGFLGRSS
jgi:MinD-like ATPase involved in chromosome partitioning or flagellar assembly